MVVNLDRLYSTRATKLKASEIRKLLKLTQLPDMISLAGGLPNPKAFPVEAMRKCLDNIFKENIYTALQYGSTEGLPLLRGELAKRMREIKGVDCEIHEIMVTHGSQQGLSLISHIFLNPGDTIIMGSPSYLGAIQAFRSYEAQCESIPLKEDGFDIQSLIRNIRRLRRNGIHPKFIYTVPSFQNPSGITMSMEKRKQLLDIASVYDMLIIEDDPYGELVFEGESIPPIKSLDEKGRVVYLATFSKILAPGFRLAWIVASDELINKFVLAKQSADLCSNSFGQYVAYEYIKGGHLDNQLEKIREMYGRKRDVMLEALEEFFPDGVEWTTPRGGMFLWVTLPKEIDASVMFKRAVAKKVAYVVGHAFFADETGKNTMRLNFSYSSDKVIREGVRRLAEVIKEELDTSYLEKPVIPEGI